MLKASAIAAWAACVIVAIGCAQSDGGITTAVKAKFATDETVKAYQIDVDTEGRVVTLSGTVETTKAKEQAVRLARDTEGVASVIDRLTVNQAATLAQRVEDRMAEAGEATADAALTAMVKAKMLADATAEALQVNVDTRDGVVTLSGTVRSAGERDRAIAMARGTEGVMRVEDKLVVKP